MLIEMDKEIITDNSFEEKLVIEHCESLPPLASLSQKELERHLLDMSARFRFSGREISENELLCIERASVHHQQLLKTTDNLLTRIASWTRKVSKQQSPIILDVGGPFTSFSKTFAEQGLTTIYVTPVESVINDVAESEKFIKIGSGVWRDRRLDRYLVLSDALATAEVFSLKKNVEMQRLFADRVKVHDELVHSLQRYDQTLRILKGLLKKKSLKLYHELLNLDDAIKVSGAKFLRQDETPIALIFSAYVSLLVDFTYVLSGILPRAIVSIEEKIEIRGSLPDAVRNLSKLEYFRSGSYHRELIPGPNYIELVNVDIPSEDPFRSDSFLFHCRKDVCYPCLNP
ncbi:hypothetical protein A2291_00320 [candidate division WOR-1 bacterium RIFOXYB2_FULL_42_35]|uniref:Uncharacterized protein n=1 Tax=candidate division WOR-1 bacterium RIFOXYC2_FULL_41_25 TaxID=1802586 RepID=A0A1F4TMT8_UNCSA|nr:MAG: hypothetical protein A2247_01455 [candidate division WOR-1 bacterium RIFOXYA2_FULL_41_14]OGC24246.1 MAG: hypothetical protein A2291_00320 [candidate division WOR-1 bacterium RIFOXYB2_FULL_42_35]OGC33889.1 MAG: hypothetical protein A2462_01290 [candidate division WOR-1 bacterium RIFOXYC2_FULL_41_25]